MWRDSDGLADHGRRACPRGVDPDTGEMIRTVKSKRFATGVTGWRKSSGTAPRNVTRGMCGESIPNGNSPEAAAAPGVDVSGLESDGSVQFFCGGKKSGKVLAIRRPRW